MKKKIIFRFVLGIVLAGACVISTARADKILYFAAASEIAKAYGEQIRHRFEKRSGVRVQMYIGPNDTVLSRLIQDVSDIATVTRRLPRRMKEQGYVEIPFCKDGLAVITNTQCTLDRRCPIDNLSMRQLQGIFSGRIKNWKDLGGPDTPIFIIVPGRETGAYMNFSQIVMDVHELDYDFIAADSTLAIDAIRFIPGAVSFIAQGVIEDEATVKVIRVDGLTPQDENYPIFQTYSFVTKGEPEGYAREAINFGLSREGIDYMKKRGMFPVLE